MKIVMEIIEKNGISKRLEIQGAARGSELAILEQFIADPSILSRESLEAVEGPQEPENRLRDYRTWTARAIEEALEEQRENDRRSGRLQYSPLDWDPAPHWEPAPRVSRVERTETIRTVNNLHQAAADCLKMLEDSRKAQGRVKRTQ